LRDITGIEIDITNLQGTWEVSQNKTIEDNRGVCEGLKMESFEASDAMAFSVEERRN
jgi:transcriptional regulator